MDVVVRVLDLVGSLNQSRLNLDVVIRHRQEPLIPVCAIETSCIFTEIVVNRRLDLTGREPVNDGVNPLDMRQTKRAFLDLIPRGGVNVEDCCLSGGLQLL